MSSRHYRTSSHNHTSSSSSSSTSPIHRASSSAEPSLSISEPDHTTEGRRRRGRQARPSQLSSKMRKACHRFSDAVGAPTVVAPAGFRDFRGWLALLGSRQCRGVWDELLASIAKEVNCDSTAVHALKEDIVREIIKCVVVPRPDESAKLVSTNAGRQASRPRSGTTLMVVLEQQLARVDRRLPQLVAQVSGSSSSATKDDSMVASRSDGIRRQDRQRGSHSNSIRGRDVTATPLNRNTDQLPSVSDILGHRSAALPSFGELEASLRGSSHSRRR